MGANQFDENAPLEYEDEYNDAEDPLAKLIDNMESADDDYEAEDETEDDGIDDEDVDHFGSGNLLDGGDDDDDDPRGSPMYRDDDDEEVIDDKTKRWVQQSYFELLCA